MSGIQVTWLPVVGSTDTQFIAESDSPFGVVVSQGECVQQVGSEHDGLMHFVSIDVPEVARVEVQG